MNHLEDLVSACGSGFIKYKSLVTLLLQDQALTAGEVWSDRYALTGPFMQQWHQFEIRTDHVGIARLELFKGSIEINLALMQHDDPRAQPHEQILVMRDDDGGLS